MATLSKVSAGVTLNGDAHRVAIGMPRHEEGLFQVPVKQKDAADAGTLGPSSFCMTELHLHVWLRCKSFECFESIFWQPFPKSFF